MRQVGEQRGCLAPRNSVHLLASCGLKQFTSVNSNREKIYK